MIYSGQIILTNVNFTNFWVKAQHYTGVISGFIDSTRIVFTNISFQNITLDGGNFVGIIGRWQNGANAVAITNCSIYDARMTGTTYLGILAGYNYNNYNSALSRLNFTYINVTNGYYSGAFGFS
jgi:hypothetical protein